MARNIPEAFEMARDALKGLKEARRTLLTHQRRAAHA
jgi:hypothetical protein